VTFYIFDTDHITLLREGNSHIRQRFLDIPADNLGVTIVSYEEQVRGWLALIRRANHLDKTIWAYRRLHETLDFFRAVKVLDFDEPAGEIFAQLRKERVRIGTQDLRIASIALAHGGILVTRNAKDYAKVEGLVFEDWSG
jgi:tRNA(fMet)-specific endonuclease VapC